MDFKAYAKQKRLETHRGIILDICIEVNNCANCYNDETHRTECFPLLCVPLHKVTVDSFYMESYDNSKINRRLLAVASQHGYKAGFIMEGGVNQIKFWNLK